MSSSIPFTTLSNPDASKCFKWRKKGANKIYWWVISGKYLQDKYQTYTFIGEDCKATCAKLESWCTTLKAWQLHHLNVTWFCALDSLQKLTARCPVLAWYTVTNMTRCFGTKNNRKHLVGLLTSSATHGSRKKICIFILVGFEERFPSCLGV